MAYVQSHARSGTWVSDHYRNGTFVSGHYRGYSHVSGHARGTSYSHATSSDDLARSRLLRSGSLIYSTHCWWCSERVYFFRSENGGCALFDLPRYPWPLHRCWLEYRSKCLGHLSRELAERAFDGQVYTLAASPLRPPRSESIFDAIVFVARESYRRAPVTRLRCRRGASSILLSCLRLGLLEQDRFVDCLIPQSSLALFPPFSLHQVTAQWIKQGGRWRCAILKTRRLESGRRPSGPTHQLLRLNRSCWTCGSSLDPPAKWGFDDVGHEECLSCSSMRASMTSHEFLRRLAAIAQKLDLSQ